MGESLTVEEIISEYQTYIIRPDKCLTDEECLCESVRRRLYRVGKMDSPLNSVPEESFEARTIFGCRNNEDISDTSEHECRDRIVDHRLIIDGHELLRDGSCDGIETRPCASCEDDSFHRQCRIYSNIRKTPSNTIHLLDF